MSYHVTLRSTVFHVCSFTCTSVMLGPHHVDTKVTMNEELGSCDTGMFSDCPSHDPEFSFRRPSPIEPLTGDMRGANPSSQRPSFPFVVVGGPHKQCPCIGQRGRGLVLLPPDRTAARGVGSAGTRPLPRSMAALRLPVTALVMARVEIGQRMGVGWEWSVAAVASGPDPWAAAPQSVVGSEAQPARNDME